MGLEFTAGSWAVEGKISAGGGGRLGSALGEAEWETD